MCSKTRLLMLVGLGNAACCVWGDILLQQAAGGLKGPEERALHPAFEE